MVETPCGAGSMVRATGPLLSPCATLMLCLKVKRASLSNLSGGRSLMREGSSRGVAKTAYRGRTDLGIFLSHLCFL